MACSFSKHSHLFQNKLLTIKLQIQNQLFFTAATKTNAKSSHPYLSATSKTILHSFSGNSV